MSHWNRHTALSVVDAAAAAFGIFGGERPKLVEIGIDPVDRALGGLFPGTSIVLGMDQSIGKSRTVLQAARRSQDKWGIISLEDPEDVIGSRLLAMESGVNPLKMRRGELSDAERRQISEARERLEHEDGIAIACCVGGSIEDVEEAVAWLASEGCAGVWVDYLQKIRGIRDDRNNEVAAANTRIHRACAQNSLVAGVCSQMTGAIPGERPRASQLRETRDIANEARVIILGWRDEGGGPDRQDLIRFVMDKSTFGGAGTSWACVNDRNGMLKILAEDQEDF